MMTKRVQTIALIAVLLLEKEGTSNTKDNETQRESCLVQS